MRQIRAVLPVLVAGLLVCMPVALAAQADTSFTEPSDRPDNPELAPALPEPVAPPAPTVTEEPSGGDEADTPVDSEPGSEGYVDGQSVGTLASPALPGTGAAGASPVFRSAAREELFRMLDPGSSGPAGTFGSPGTPGDTERTVRGGRAAPGAASVATTLVPRTPPITADPEAVPDLNVDARWPAVARASGGIVAAAQVIAYYGHPNSRFMGILGENEIGVMAEQLKARAAEYDVLNGEIDVAPAFHIIYGTVYEDASVGILRESKAIEYIEYALENDIIVFLDHQIGSGTVEGAVRAMLPWLRYPNVHLAFDPEWATDQPGKVIGGVHADDINLAQQMIQDYLVEHRLPGPRMLVVHQFNWRMIEERERVRANYPLVQLIHHADGFGNPPNKRASWQFNVIATNMPLKGFKLFYPKSWRDGGYDDPLMTPAEVMQLEPVPVYIQYQ